MDDSRSLISASTTTGAELLVGDWSATALGPLERWPIALTSTLALMLACPAPMFLAWGPDLQCFYNDAYRPILGFRLASALGRPFNEVWASIWDEIEPLVASTLAGESCTMTDMPLDLARNGEPEESWWTFSYSPAYDETGAVAGLLCVTSEQTSRIRTTEHLTAQSAALAAEVLERRRELARAEEHLRQSQKIEAIGRLTGGVAHDFNNLLTVIRGSVDLLRRPNLSPEKRDRYINAIGDTADRAAKLTGQLLAFARRQSLQPALFDLGPGIADVASMVRTLIGSRIRLDLRLPEQPVFVMADRSQFDAAIVNMAVNARDAMAGEGTLTIAAGPATGIPALRGHAPVTGRFVSITISDTGAGIDADSLGHIYEPFFTTKPVGEGTGLGLSQVIGFAKQSGGDIQVESEIGRGTVFTLYLPRSDRSAEPAGPDAAAAAEPMPRGEGACVLVVEDNIAVGEFATGALRELGYDCVLAFDAEQALGILAADDTRFRAVFSDVVMPGMGGVELGKRIRATYPDLPMVLTSGYSHVLAESGTHGFELLHKPYSVEQLARVLRGAIATGR